MAKTTTTSAPLNSPGRVITASMIGTTIEFYDFYVYATAAVLVFPQLFFKTGNPTTALLASFAVFGAAMVARPIGAIFFGHLGDRRGRKTTLVISLLVMGIATFLIGCLPTYSSVGVLAPFLLLVLRLTQGFALGGEWSGSGPGGDRERPGRQARPVRHLPAAGRSARFHHRERGVPDHQLRAAPPRRPHPALRGLPGLGLAGAVPVLGRDGHRRALGAAAAGRVRDLPDRRGARRDPQAAALDDLPLQLARGHPRHLHHAGHVRALLPDVELHVDLRDREDGCHTRWSGLQLHRLRV